MRSTAQRGHDARKPDGRPPTEDRRPPWLHQVTQDQRGCGTRPPPYATADPYQPAAAPTPPATPDPAPPAPATPARTPPPATATVATPLRAELRGITACRDLAFGNPRFGSVGLGNIGLCCCGIGLGGGRIVAARPGRARRQQRGPHDREGTCYSDPSQHVAAGENCRVVISRTPSGLFQIDRLHDQ